MKHGILTVAVLLVPGFVFAEDAKVPSQGEIELMVKKLGATKYKDRVAAAHALRDLGAPAIPALEKAKRFEELEIKRMAGKLLVIVKRRELEMRLERFEKGDKKAAPAGWGVFAKHIGNSKKDKQFFIDMVQAVPDLFRLWKSEDEQEFLQTFNTIYSEIQNESRFRGGQNVNVHKVASMLFIAGDSELKFGPNVLQQMTSFTYYQSVRNRLANQADPVHKVVGYFVGRPDPSTAYNRMMLGIQHNMKAALNPAYEILQGQNVNNYQLQYAMLTLARMGGKAEKKTFEGMLKDNTVLYQQVNFRDPQRKPMFVVKTKDMALACLIHLNKMNPKAFGYPRLRTNTRYLYQYSTVGFENEEQRKGAFDKFAEFKKSGKKPVGADKMLKSTVPQIRGGRIINGFQQQIEINNILPNMPFQQKIRVLR